MLCFRIYQADDGRSVFRPLRVVGSPDPKIYELVYSGSFDLANSKDQSDYERLEELFYIFNMKHPHDYKARSMSVSDVVELYDESGNRFYYCDNVGFRPITFDKEKVII